MCVMVGKKIERDYNGYIIRRCSDCKWCKSLEGSDMKTYYFCMDINGGAFLEETDLLGWCTSGDEEGDWYDEGDEI